MSDFLNPSDVALELGLNISTVYRGLEDGDIPGTKIRGRWRTLRSQLVERLADDRLPKPRAASDPMPRPGRGRFAQNVVDLEARRTG